MHRFTHGEDPVRVERGRFSRHIDLSGGLRIMGDVAFEAEVHWLRTATSRSALIDRQGGTISQGTGYVDHRGPLCSVLSALDDALALVERHGLGPGDGMRAVVTTTYEDRPGIPDRGTEAMWGRPYLALPDDWTRADDPAVAAWNAADYVGRAGMAVPYLKRTTAWQGVTFDSRLGSSAGDQAATFPGLVAAALAGVAPGAAEEARTRFLDGYASRLPAMATAA